MANIKQAITNALASSSSQRPISIDELFSLGQRKKIQAVLLEMYRQREVCCCLVTRKDVQKSVWWRPNGTIQSNSYGHSRIARGNDQR